MLTSLAVTALLGYSPMGGLRPRVARAATTFAVRMAETDAAFGASHTSMYTDAVAKDSYETLDEVNCGITASKLLAS
jgi:hypothetical protein